MESSKRRIEITLSLELLKLLIHQKTVEIEGKDEVWVLSLELEASGISVATTAIHALDVLLDNRYEFTT